MTTTHTRDYDQYAPLLVEYADGATGEARRADLRSLLVDGFRPVVRNIAARYARRGEPSDDLEQVAAIGLLHALDRFDPERGREFLSFAIPTMMGEVRRHFRDASWSVHTPRAVKDRYLQVGSATASLSQRIGRAPTVPELAEHLGISTAEVHEAYAAGNSFRPESLDRALVGADESTLVDVISAVDPDLERTDLRVTVGALLAELPVRERTLLVLRYVHEMTQRQIAAELCISQMHVSRLLTQTLALLRERLERDDAGAPALPALAG